LWKVLSDKPIGVFVYATLPKGGEFEMYFEASGGVDGLRLSTASERTFMRAPARQGAAMVVTVTSTVGFEKVTNFL
jgi:hypothetical protein